MKDEQRHERAVLDFETTQAGLGLPARSASALPREREEKPFAGTKRKATSGEDEIDLIEQGVTKARKVVEEGKVCYYPTT